jgi:TRAP-type C4-dicarboxylate transport system permease small subunit
MIMQVTNNHPAPPAKRNTNILEKIANGTDKLLNISLQAILVTITCAVSWQVFSRYVLSDPSSFTEELARFLLIWLTLLGAVFAYRHKIHLGLDMFYRQGSLTQRKWMYFIIHSCVAAFSINILIIGGFSLVNMTEQLGQTSPVMGIDISKVYWAIPASGILTTFYALLALLGLSQGVDDLHANEEGL